MIHELKIQTEYFEAVISGKKGFEVRLNDRDFKEGDYLALNEYKNGKHTGRSCMVYVDYILAGFIGVSDNYVVMSIKPCYVTKGKNPFFPGSVKTDYQVPVLGTSKIDCKDIQDGDADNAN